MSEFAAGDLVRIKGNGMHHWVIETVIDGEAHCILERDNDVLRERFKLTSIEKIPVRAKT
jgi:hypothetical protein